MLKIIVSKWGDMYSEEYIDRLRESIEKHTTVPWKLLVVRDHDNCFNHLSRKHFRGTGTPQVVQGEGWVNGYHHFNLGGLPLYKKTFGWFADDYFDDDDIIISMDIDMIVTGDLDYFTILDYEKPWVQYDYAMSKQELIEGHWEQNITPINTSVLAFKKGQLDPIRKCMEKHAEEIFFTYRRVDAFVWYQFGVKGFFNYLPKSIVDWHYSEHPSLIRNLAGEKINLKNGVIIDG